MAPKAQKEAPASPTAEAKAKASKTKKAVLRGAHGHTEKKLHATPTPDNPRRWLHEAAPGETSLATTLSSSSPTPESAMRKRGDHNTPLFSGDAKANKHQLRRAVEKLYDSDKAKVNTLMGPDGEKAACLMGPRLWRFGCCQQNREPRD